MLPTAGLFLPETLHRREDSTSSSTNVDSSKLKYFQRRNPRPSQETRTSADQTSIVSSIKTSSADDPTNDFSSLATAFNFADFVSSSNKASSETVSFAQLIKDVQKDITEASRLYLSPAVSNFLDAWPDKRTWVDKTLLAVRSALNDIGVAMDSSRVDGEENSSNPPRHRFEWSIGHQKRLSKKQQQLKTCHHDLQGAIHVMQTVELCGLPGGALQDPIFEAPSRPWMPSEDKNALRGPYSRQRYRISHNNLSATSVTLSEGGRDSFDAISIKSQAVELPGSTPVDLISLNPSLCPSPRRQVPSNTSITLTRSRARSDHGRPLVAPELKLRASFDVTRPLAALQERTIERNDSTTSTTTTVTVPLIAKRYRAQTINVHRQSERHRSLPSELPYLTSQSSLVDDLADYVLPSAKSDQLPSMEWKGDSVLSLPVPTTERISSHDRSIGSMPGSDGFQEIFPLHDSSGVSTSLQDAGDLRTVSIHEDGTIGRTASAQNLETSSEQRLDRGQPKRTAPLLPASPLVSRKPVPPSSNTEPSIHVSKDSSVVNPTTNITPTPNISDEAISQHTLSGAKTSSTPVRQSAPVSPNTTEEGPEIASDAPPPQTNHKINDDAELSLLQQRMLRQTYVKDIEQEAPSLQIPEQTAPLQSQPSPPVGLEKLPSPPEPPIPASPDVSISKIPFKPMSAQAKRQAVHRRRMEMAFGKV